MENISNKAKFLKEEYTKILSALDERTAGKWGKMNVRQMIEHMSDYVRIASGKTELEVMTAEEHLPRMQAFLASEKPFKENTPNALMADTPPPVRHANQQDAIEELQSEINHFFEAHELQPDKKTPNPFFGVLDFDHQVQLLYKHATHHLRQFGLDY